MALRVGIDGRVLADAFPGIGRYTFGLLLALPATAPDIEFVVLFDPQARNTRFDLDDLRQRGLSLHPLAVPARSPAEQWRLPRCLHALRLDVVHAPYAFTAWACPVPRVLSVYDTIALDRRFGLRPWPRRLAAGLLLRSQAHRAAAIVTPSCAAADAVVHGLGVPAARVHVVPAGIEPGFGHVTDTARAAARHELGLPASYVLAVGTHKPHKNLAGLLAGWRVLRASGTRPPALVLAGVGPHGVARLRADHDLDALGVQALPEVPEALLPALYANATLLVVPSLDEGFGLALLEGMAAGVPVLAARSGALPEVAAEAAELFDPRDATALATSLRALLADAPRRRALAHRGRLRAGAFSWPASARVAVEVYRRAARVQHGALSSVPTPAAVPQR